MWQAACSAAWSTAVALGLASNPMPQSAIAVHCNQVLTELHNVPQTTPEVQKNLLNPTMALVCAALRDAPPPAHLGIRDVHRKILYFCEKCADLRIMILRGAVDPCEFAHFDPTLPQQQAYLVAELGKQHKAYTTPMPARFPNEIDGKKMHATLQTIIATAKQNEVIYAGPQ